MHEQKDYSIKLVTLGSFDASAQFFGCIEQQNQQKGFKRREDMEGIGYRVKYFELSAAEGQKSVHCQTWMLNNQISLVSPSLFFKSSCAYLIFLDGQNDESRELLRVFVAQIRLFEQITKPIYVVDSPRPSAAETQGLADSPAEGGVQGLADSHAEGSAQGLEDICRENKLELNVLTTPEQCAKLFARILKESILLVETHQTGEDFKHCKRKDRGCLFLC